MGRLPKWEERKIMLAVVADQTEESETPTKRQRLSGTASAPSLSANRQANNASRSFNFMGLPPELRLHVYRYLIPHGLTIHLHERLTCKCSDCRPSFPTHIKHPRPLKPGPWVALQPGEVLLEEHPIKDETRLPCHFGVVDSTDVATIWRHYAHCNPQTSLFLVNKVISAEARAVLYQHNTFVFAIHGDPHRPVSLRSPKIFDVFGEEGRLPLLRELRSIEIALVLDDTATNLNFWHCKRLSARLEYFISVLKEYADDDKKKSLLTSLHVRYLGLKTFKAGLWLGEHLTTIRGVRDVRVTADHGAQMPDWFASCLELCFKGKGGDVLPLDYPDIEVKTRKHRRAMWKTTMRSTKEWDQPALNWEEFAKRNGIDIPDDWATRFDRGD
ncbi:hypothetical protein M011DRAFT_478193 [Sporormia fimetaria CBS 119925]|uniref:F-box domain-containing protein n=1 Tax=Sporormia fimetaria CBS 119925 TaxID=1340428 RepID=A0A6A6V8Y9_9PLEO|nr:hypothetical protein M011DRAFT_478193 [Sporormia fimetaria CBS 119925]